MKTKRCILAGSSEGPGPLTGLFVAFKLQCFGSHTKGVCKVVGRYNNWLKR